MKYDKPTVEIIDFVALEKLANDWAQKVIDDNVNIGDRPGLNESVVEWPDE